jgi:hypothetical protein
MYLEHTRSILERVLYPLRAPGQLPAFADGDESRREMLRHRGANDEPARFDGHHMRHAVTSKGSGERTGRLLKKGRIG